MTTILVSKMTLCTNESLYEWGRVDMHATPPAPYFKHANIFGYIKYIGPPLFLKPGSAPVTSDVLWKDNWIAYHNGTNTDIFRWKKISFTYDELDAKQKNIKVRSFPATNFFLAWDRYRYAVIEMKPHIQAAKWHQYEVYRANRVFLVIFWYYEKNGQRSIIEFVRCHFHLFRCHLFLTFRNRSRDISRDG